MEIKSTGDVRRWQQIGNGSERSRAQFVSVTVPSSTPLDSAWTLEVEPPNGTTLRFRA